MANKTRHSAQQIHGTNPQFLIEKVIRSRIYDSLYWKEHCFALTAETLIDKAIALEYVGGTFGVQKPSPFLCLVLKLLQLQPEREIILEYLKATDFKYLRAVAALYVRLTFKSLDIYETLEPLLDDYRKIRRRQMDGSYYLSHIDEFVDELLTQERACDLTLPRLTRRQVLEETEGLDPRKSQLEDGLLAAEDHSDAEDGSHSSWREKILRNRQQRGQVRPERYNSVDLEAASIDEDDDIGYVSQEPSESEDEDGDRLSFVSRSHSRSVSPDLHAKSPGQRSVSPTSRSSPRGSDPGFVSRSPSRSP